MAEIVIFNNAEQMEPADLTAIGEQARAGQDAITSGAIDFPHHWADHTVSKQTETSILISAGSLFRIGEIFQNTAPISLNLQPYMPIVSGDFRIVAVLLRGENEEKQEARFRETDVEPRQLVLEALPKRDIRTITPVIQQGLASPTPLKPSVASDQCILCWVELAATGIASIEMEQGSRVKTLYEVEGRVSGLEGRANRSDIRTNTLETDLSALASRTRDIPPPTVIRQLMRDAAALRRESRLPAEARSYWYDAGLLPDEWDKSSASWLARVREGVRFPFAAERDMQLSLIDQASSAIRVKDNILLPAWTEKARLVVEPDGTSVNISQQVHTVVTAVRREIARKVTEFGPTFNICENNAEWSMYAHLSVGELFTRNGEVFQVVGVVDASIGHQMRAVKKVVERTVIETYWDYVTETFGINGSVHGNTFLQAQPGVLTSIDLYFTRVGSAGDVHLVVAECDSGGKPDFSRVIAKTVLPQASLAVGWNNFAFRPSYIKPGKQICWFTVTTGNHALGAANGNTYTQGSQFICTDGVWSQVLTNTDFAMRMNYAQFNRTRTEVEFNPLTLENGMTQIKLLHGGWWPDGCAFIWEIKPSGAEQWQAVTVETPDGADALVGLPALTQLRAVFLGTTDLQPALVLDATARGATARHRGDMVAITKVQEFGLSSTQTQIEVVVDNFDPAKHTCIPKLVIDTTVYDPSITVATVDPTRPKRRSILSTFTHPATTSAHVRTDMTTTEVTDVPFIQNIARYSL